MRNKYLKARNGLFIVPACPICGQAPRLTEGFIFDEPDIRYKIQCPNTQHRPVYALAPTPELAVLGWWREVERIKGGDNGQPRQRP